MVETGGENLLNDHELMERVKQGDKEAYEVLVLKYRQAGIAFSKQIVKDEYLAEDVVQDCFANIYIIRHRYNNRASFKTYLFTLIKNRSIDYLRKQKETAKLCNLDELSYAASSTEQVYIEKERLDTIYRYLNQMKGESGQMLYLYAVEDLSYDEIARVMKQSKAQVKIKLYRARQKLKLLREMEGEV